MQVYLLLYFLWHLINLSHQFVFSTLSLPGFLSQTVEHGFPHQPSALASDPKLQLMAIGTKSGAIKMYPSVSELMHLQKLFWGLGKG